MGGFVRSITRKILRVVKKPPQVQAPVAEPVAVSEAPTDITAQKKAAMGSGYGAKTILTSVQGDETEANVSKTILGGGKKKKIRA